MPQAAGCPAVLPSPGLHPIIHVQTAFHQLILPRLMRWIPADLVVLSCHCAEPGGSLKSPGATHACAPSCGGRTGWFKSQCKTRLSYGRQKRECQNTLVLLPVLAYLVTPILSEIPHRPWFVQRELATANACLFCVKQSCFFPSCFCVVATRGKRRWGGEPWFWNKETDLNKKWVDLRHLSEVFV